MVGMTDMLHNHLTIGKRDDCAACGQLERDMERCREAARNAGSVRLLSV